MQTKIYENKGGFHCQKSSPSQVTAIFFWSFVGFLMANLVQPQEMPIRSLTDARFSKNLIKAMNMLL